MADLVNLDSYHVLTSDRVSADYTHDCYAGADSWYSGLYPQNVLDNNPSSWWASNNTLPAIIRFYFTEKRVVNRIVMQARSDGYYQQGPGDFTIEASNTGYFDGEEVTLDTQTSITWTAGEIKTFSFTNTNYYQFYQINTTDSQAGNAAALATVRFLNTDAVSPSPYFSQFDSDLTSGETTDASSYYGSQVSSYAIDDNSNTFWVSNNELPCWWEIQFASAQKINKINMQTRPDSYWSQICTKFTIDASNTGAFAGEEDELLYIDDCFYGWTQGEIRTITFDNENSYSYYRINISESQGGSASGFGELEFIEGYQGFTIHDGIHFLVDDGINWTPTRITHAVAQVLRSGDPSARITQALTQVLRSGDPAIRITQALTQVLRATYHFYPEECYHDIDTPEIALAEGSDSGLAIDPVYHDLVSESVDWEGQYFINIAEAYHLHYADYLNLTVPEAAITLANLDSYHLHYADEPNVYSFVIADCYHLHVAEQCNVSMEAAITLANLDAYHLHYSDSPNVYSLVPNDCYHEHYVDEPNVYSLVPNDCYHLHDVDPCNATEAGWVTLTNLDAYHEHYVDPAPLIIPLLIDEAYHLQYADEPNVYSLIPDECYHLHYVDSPNLTTFLDIAEVYDEHYADNIDLIVFLDISESHHEQYVDSIPLIVPLNVEECYHLHGVDDFSLTQTHILADLDCYHEHYSDTLGVFHGVVTGEDCYHEHYVDSVVLTVNLIVAECYHINAPPVDLALTQLHDLAVDESYHLQTADNISLKPILDVSGCYHDIASDELGLGIHLVIPENYHEILDEIYFIVPIEVSASDHLHASDNLDLIQRHSIVVAESYHLQESEDIDLTQRHNLTVRDSVHVLATPTVDLTQNHYLAIDECDNFSYADSVALIVFLSISDGNHNLEDDFPYLTVPLTIVGDYIADVADFLTITQLHYLHMGSAVDNWHILVSDTMAWHYLPAWLGVKKVIDLSTRRTITVLPTAEAA